MYYSFKNGVHAVEMDQWDENELTAGCMTPEEWKKSGVALGFPEDAVGRYDEETHHFHTRVENYEGYSFIFFRLPEGKEEDNERSVALYLRKNRLMIVEPAGKGNQLRERFEAVLQTVSLVNPSMGRLLYALFNSLLDRCDAALETVEQQIEELGDMVMSEKIEDKFTQRLMRVKRHLLKRHTFCDAVILVAEKLEAAENGVLSERSDIRFLHLLSERSARQLNDIATLREESAAVWEAYQTTIDLRLNNIMKVFTVVSAIFLPLTLITGWYGMNFTGMTELSWEYGYPAVAVLCILVVLVCIWFFKKKHWM